VPTGNVRPQKKSVPPGGENLEFVVARGGHAGPRDAGQRAAHVDLDPAVPDHDGAFAAEFGRCEGAEFAAVE
jgi:hypothetical protein